MQSLDIEALNQQIHHDSAFVELLNEETAKIIVGQKNMIERLMIGLLTKGHILLEGLPGLAKTLAIKTLSTAINSSSRRTYCPPTSLVRWSIIPVPPSLRYTKARSSPISYWLTR